MMTRSEAIQAMKKGERVTHTLFSPKEWMEDIDGMFKFEDGCRCEYREFWNDRQYPAWLNGWTLVTPVKSSRTKPVKHWSYPASRKPPIEGDKVCILVWPDGEWCHAEALIEHFSKSDDYLEISVDDELDEEQIDVLVMNRYNPSQSTSHPEEHF